MGSRRLDASLDALERGTRAPAAMRNGTVKLRKMLKKLRHRAGWVRDLDVHRGLLRNLASEGEAGESAEAEAAERVQDAIGIWHDWAELTEEACEAGAAGRVEKRCGEEGGARHGRGQIWFQEDGVRAERAGHRVVYGAA